MEDMHLDNDNFNDDDVSAAVDSAQENLQNSFAVLNLSKDTNTTVEFLVNNIINNVGCEHFEWDKYVNILKDQRARANNGSEPLNCFHCGKKHTLRDCTGFKEELLRAAQPLTAMMNKFKMKHGEKGQGALAHQIRSLDGFEPFKNQARNTNQGWNNRGNSRRNGYGTARTLNNRQL